MQFKKSLKIIILAISITLTSFHAASSTQTVVVEAATKIPTFKDRSLKLKIGDTHKLKIKNITKKAKIKWKTGDKNVLSVSKKGVVTAKSIGMTYVQAKIKDKKLSWSLVCNIEVVTDFDENKAKEKIKFTPIENSDGIYMVTSTYKYPTRVSIDYRVNNKDGLRTGSGKIYAYAVPWDETYVKIPLFKDDETTTIEYKYSYQPCIYTEDEWNELCNSLEMQYDIFDILQLGNGKSYFRIKFYLKNISNKEINIKYPLSFCMYDYNGNIIDLATISCDGILYQNETIECEPHPSLILNNSFDNQSIQKFEFFINL